MPPYSKNAYLPRAATKLLLVVFVAALACVSLPYNDPNYYLISITVQDRQSAVLERIKNAILVLIANSIPDANYDLQEYDDEIIVNRWISRTSAKWYRVEVSERVQVFRVHVAAIDRWRTRVTITVEERPTEFSMIAPQEEVVPLKPSEVDAALKELTRLVLRKARRSGI